jgi:hypothetical protein
MAITKKDYEVMAAIIKIAREQYPDSNDTLDAVSNMLAGAFSVSSPRFDMEIWRVKSGTQI